jgi:ACS family tartrate transporter-like MFS transporter
MPARMGGCFHCARVYAFEGTTKNMKGKHARILGRIIMPSLEQTTMRKIYLRLLPIAILTYFLCYLDRINVGFAALTMNKDIGLDAAIYGMAAGAFFWGYCLFEVPSNIILERVGARRWIARIMVTWGIMSGATAFCTGPWSFMIVRFFLGVAEAGLFPGVILYLTYWFPDQHRARIISGFMLALPLAVATGAPMSTALLELNGTLGLAGWKWMFIAEAVPTVLVGIFVWFYMTDRPALATWLTKEESGWLSSTIDRERRAVETRRKISMWQSFWDPKVILLSLNYFGIVTASLGMLLFLPQMVKQLGVTNMQVGWITMIPYLLGAVAMVICGAISDRMGERRWNLFTTCMISTGGLVMAGLTIGTAWAVVGMSIAAIGFYGSKGPFWSMPPALLTGTAAASGIAWINSIGNLGGFFGPSIVGWVRTATGSFAGGLYALAAFSLMSAIIAALWLHIPRLAAHHEIAEPVPA